MARRTAPHPARAIFERAIADAKAAGDTARADDRRLLCEFFCDPAFRAALSDEVARLTGCPT